MNRRTFAKLALAASIGVSGWAVWEMRSERRRLRLEAYSLPVRGLPLALEGLRIAVMSDLHAGDFTPWSLIHRAVSLAVEASPDIVFLLGDYTSMSADSLEEPLATALRPLRARYGVWAVLGNHEYVRQRHDPVARALRSAGVHLLENQAQQVDVRDEKIWICGVRDPYLNKDDLAKTLAAVPRGAFKLLLAHSPDIIYRAARAGVNAVFAGHTHGGQVRLPLLGPLAIPSKYGRRFAQGVFEVDGTALFVTRGIGTTPPLVRLGCPPEVALVTLEAGAVVPSAAADPDSAGTL